jgi:RNA polymerase sigma factor (sigma-70 family)
MERAPDQLFARAQQGDRSVLPDLLAAHAEALVGFLRLHSSPRLRLLESAADLAQSTCREVLQGLDRFEFRDPASFRAWIFQRALMVLQRRQRYHSARKRDAARQVELSAAEERALLDTYSGVLSPSRHAAAREDLERFEAVFDQLPADYQQVISLARIGQLPHAQIAAVMERSEPAVRNLLSRALARLAELMVGSKA